jgi:hypothetical protein
MSQHWPRYSFLVLLAIPSMTRRSQNLTLKVVHAPPGPRPLGAPALSLTRWVLAVSTFAFWLRCSRPTETVGTPLLAILPLILRKSSWFRIKRPAPERTSPLNRLCANWKQENHLSPIPKRISMSIAREAYMRFFIPTGIPAMRPTSLCFLIHAGTISERGPSDDRATRAI